MTNKAIEGKIIQSALIFRLS